MSRKRITNLFAAVVICFLSVFSETRQVYITLDDSGSMYGDKYMISNYTAQLISLLNKENEVYLIINGVVHKISGSPYFYKKIQISQQHVVSAWGNSAYGTQIGDINAFIHTFKENADNNQWLFIIGDGDWNTGKFTATTEKFTNIAQKSRLNIFHIPYGSNEYDQSDFTTYIRQLKSARILNGSRSTKNIFNNCVVLIYYLTKTDCLTPRISTVNDQTIEISSTLPAQKFLIFYQDYVTENMLPDIEMAVQDSVRLKPSLLGQPSTSALRHKNNQTLLSSNLWEIEGSKNIKTNVVLTLKFDKPVDLGKLKVFILPDKQVAQKTDSVIQVNSKNNTTVNGYKRTESILILSKKELDNALQNSTGINQSNKISEEKKLSKNSYRQKIEKLKPNALTYLAPQLTPITFKKIIGGKPRTGYIMSIKRNEILNPENSDIIIPDNFNFYFRNIFSWTDDDKIIFLLEPRSVFSSLFLPDTVELKAKITPKSNLFTSNSDQKPLLIKTAIPVRKTGLSEFISAVVLCSIFLFFLLLLSRKARFKKGATLIYNTGNEAEYKMKIILRKKGFANWLNRWFNPFVPEKSELIFEKMSQSITFIAKRKRSAVKIPQKDYNSQNMCFVQDAWKDKNYVDLAEGNVLIIKADKKETDKSVKITYDRAKEIKDDVPVFRASLIVAVCILLASLFFL